MIACEEYGEALYTLAVQNGRIQEFDQNLSAITQVLKSHPEYVRLLDTPAVPTKEKLTLISEAFAGAEPLVLNFMMILCEKHAVYLVPDCYKVFKRIYFEEHNIAEAVCVTARPLSAAQTSALQTKLQTLTGKTIHLRCDVDPAVIGGIVLRCDGRQFDGTIRAKLETLRHNLASVIV
ncbi:MAG: ATP synthase F1 subunit delta [Clostridia bacterium]|nr:ATP synthase F1 subunit delta [Clostridia bacterium]